MKCWEVYWIHLYLCAAAEQWAYGTICTLHVSSPLPGSRKWSVHEAEGSTQETSIKECLIMGRELLELEAKGSSERPELFAGSQCSGERLLFSSIQNSRFKVSMVSECCLSFWGRKMIIRNLSMKKRLMREVHQKGHISTIRPTQEDF